MAQGEEEEVEIFDLYFFLVIQEPNFSIFFSMFLSFPDFLILGLSFFLLLPATQRVF